MSNDEFGDCSPFIRYHTFGDSGIGFSFIFRVKEVVNQHLVLHEFLKRLKRRYDHEGILIPCPIRQAAWRPDSEHTR